MLAVGRVLVIHNPAAGRARPDAVEAALRAALERLGADADVRRTSGAEDVTKWAEAAHRDGYAVVLVAGGDGTVAAAACGIVRAGHDLPLGVVPTGTGNGLARALRIPVDPAQAIEALGRGQVVALDVLRRVGTDTVALTFVGAGLDAEAIRDANPAAKARFGFLTYLVSGAKNLWRRRNRRIRLTIDGQQETLMAHTVTLVNAGRVEFAGRTVGPDVDPHDGQLDVAVLRHTGFWRSLAAVLRLVGGPRDAGELRQARRVVVEADPPLDVHADGEQAGSTPLDIEVLSAALSAIAGRGYPYPAESPGRSA